MSVLALAACAPEGGARVDTEPPTATAVVRRNGAEPVSLDGADLLFNSAVVVEVRLSEPGSIYYTTTGEVPTPRAFGTGVAANVLNLSLARDTTLTWRIADSVGNTDDKVYSGKVRFDLTLPVVTFDPPAPPDGQLLLEPTTVSIACNEPCALSYTLDNSAPGPGNARTFTAQDVVEFRVDRPVTVSWVAEDPAGNRARGNSVRYDLDASPPASVVDPPGGQYLRPIEVHLALQTPEDGAVVRYTTDGSEPTTTSAAAEGPLTIDVTTDLRFRAFDAAGNGESVRIARYEIGALGARAAVDGADALRADAAGTFALAASLFADAGALSGRPDRLRAYGREVEAWAAARDAVEAWMLQSRAGMHGYWSRENTERAAGATGEPDTNENGSNVDDSLGARLQVLATAVGATLPLGIQPLVFPYRGADAAFLRAPNEARNADGIPTATSDFRTLLWQGASGEDRGLDLPSVGHALDALAARFVVGTSTTHVRGAGTYAARVAPAVALRCTGCHREGAIEPTLPDAASLEPLILRDTPDESPLLALLSGEAQHFGVAAPQAQVDAVREWIAGGATAEEATETFPGTTAGEGLGAYLAAEQLGWALDSVQRTFGYDPRRPTLGPLVAGSGAWMPAVIRLVESPAPQGFPRKVEGFGAVDTSFRLREQAGLLRNLVSVAQLRATRGDLFRSAPLATRAGFAPAPDLARNVVRAVVETVRTRTRDTNSGLWRAQYDATNGLGAGLSALSLADMATALELTAAAGLDNDDALRADADEALAQLEQTMLGSQGFVRESATVFGLSYPGSAVRLVDQLAWLRALVARAEGGSADARARALEVWDRLEQHFWDEGAGAYRTTLGDRVVVYDGQLAARVLDTLAAVSRMVEGEGTVDDRRRAFFDAVVQPMRVSETWLSGEVGTSADDDQDGVRKPGEVPVRDGVAPVFKRELRFE
jgi:hypothetical protein